MALATTTTIAQQAETRFGGAYSGLGDRRQQLIDNWVARFVKTTGQQVEAGPFAQDSDDPSSFDRGLTPFQLMINLKSAHDSLGPQRSLDGLVVGTCLAKLALRVISQPHHAQFALYSVPDDVAASFDCASQMMLADPANVRRAHSFRGFVS